MRKTCLTLLALAGIGLGACGYSTGDRAVSGGLLGAGAGAAGWCRAEIAFDRSGS